MNSKFINLKIYGIFINSYRIQAGIFLPAHLNKNGPTNKIPQLEKWKNIHFDEFLTKCCLSLKLISFLFLNTCISQKYWQFERDFVLPLSWREGMCLCGLKSSSLKEIGFFISNDFCEHTSTSTCQNYSGP